MRIRLLVPFLALASALCVAQGGGGDALVPFTVVKNESQVIATIRVPAGYTEKTKSYVEGVQTVLRYPDGSYIVLQVGGAVKLPIFTDPTHRVCDKRVLPGRVIRSGNIQNTDLFWHEENTQAAFPPATVGFSNVPRNRIEIFEQSLRSFSSAANTDLKAGRARSTPRRCG